MKQKIKHKFKEIRIPARNKIIRVGEKFEQFAQHLEEAKILRERQDEYYQK